METNSPLDSLPADIVDLISNPANPDHERYQHSDPAIMARIDAAFKNLPAASNQVVLDGDVTLTADPGLAEAEATTAEFQEVLRNDPEFGGAMFEQNLEAAQRAHAHLFGNRAEEVAALCDSAWSEAEKVQGIKLLEKLEMILGK